MDIDSDDVASLQDPTSPVDGDRTSLLSIRVTDEQREVIYALFNHNDWTIQEVDTHAATLNIDISETYEEYRIPQDHQQEECDYCLCRPCITDPSNKQLWWEDVPSPPSDGNSKKRKEHYKRFWTGLLHRAIWEHPTYLLRKSIALTQDPQRQNVVLSGPRGGYHPRDIMPLCVLKLVRTWLPNPTSRPYLGHRWQ
jgi:hypothetical protein